MRLQEKHLRLLKAFKILLASFPIIPHLFERWTELMVCDLQFPQVITLFFFCLCLINGICHSIVCSFVDLIIEWYILRHICVVLQCPWGSSCSSGRISIRNIAKAFTGLSCLSSILTWMYFCKLKRTSYCESAGHIYREDD